MTSGYTSHGHPIPRMPQHGNPSSVARCGGTRICAQCQRDAAQAASNLSEREQQTKHAKRSG